MAVLEGPTVRLRPVATAEYPVVFDWYHDPELVAPFDRYESETYDSFVASLEHADGDPASLAPRFAIERRAERDLVGVVGYYRAHPVLEYLDVWYLLGSRAARGHGAGKESVDLLADHLFRTTTVERVGAVCDVENVPSFRLLERLGFRREGTLRSALFHHGRWHDVYVYGITRADRASRPAPA
jgi:RimJ/RimL family protein N-acetyltransferase